MRTIAVLSLATLAIATGAALSPGLRAEEAPTPQRPGMMDHGMMDHGGMSQMMDQCGRMMQSMMDRQAPKDQNSPQGTPPANPERKG
jgi:hypothetical protein